MLLLLLLCTSISYGSQKYRWQTGNNSGHGSSGSNGSTASRSSSASWEASASSTSSPDDTYDFCGCYKFDLVYPPIIDSDDEICYYYSIKKISDDNYCKSIEYISLGTGNLNECGLIRTDIDKLLLDYAPKCYNIDPSYDGTTSNNVQNGVAGIKIEIDSSSGMILINFLSTNQLCMHDLFIYI